ncbi:hypothetical protein IT157_10590, partial [bacterium]|nr:hypothetical protein [bacterium]
MMIRRIWIFLCAMALVSTAFAVEAPDSLTIGRVGSDVVLRWTAVPGATGYNIYKEVDPGFDPNMTFPYVNDWPSLTLSDPWTGGNQYFYAVEAVVPVGDISGTILDSNT